MALTINTKDLTQTDPLQTVKNTADVTNYQGIIDNALSGLPKLQSDVDANNTNTQSSLSRLAELNKSLGSKASDTAQANTTYGVDSAKADYDKYSQQLNDVTAIISGLSREAKAIPLKVQQANANTGATDAGVLPQTTGQLRENAIKALTQASIADVITANINNSVIRYNQAKEKAQQAIDLKYKPIETEISQLKEQLELNKTYITDPAEKKLLEAQNRILDERKRILEENKQTEKDISAIKLEVAKNGGDPSVVDGATSVGDAISKAGSALRTPNTEIVKLGDNQAYLIDKTTGKIIRSFGGTPTDGGVVVGGNGKDYANIVTTILGSGKFTKDQSNAIRNAINNGEDPFTVVKNNAKNIMGQTLATDLQKNEVAKQAMIDLNSALNQYYNAGGTTGLLKGKYENVVANLGKVNDPKLITIATQIAKNLQLYRNAVSGTAYSIQEGKEISKVFPNITKTQALNKAIVEGNLASFDSTIDNAYRTVLGSSYDKLKKAQESNATSKGSLSDRDFVAQSFARTGQKYDEVVNQTPAGQIPVVKNDTGEIGYIPFGEFDPAQYTKL